MPLREMLIVFIVVLGVGAFINGMPKDEDPMRDAVSDVQAPGSGSSSELQAKSLLDSPLIAIGTDDNFKEEVLSAKKPVLAVFYVDSDPHCSNMAPIFTSLADKFQDTLKIVKVDLMTNPTLFKKYYGQLPAMVIFKNGAQVQALAGEMTEADLIDFLSRQHIKASAAVPSSSPPSRSAMPVKSKARRAEPFSIESATRYGINRRARDRKNRAKSMPRLKFDAQFTS